MFSQLHATFWQFGEPVSGASTRSMSQFVEHGKGPRMTPSDDPQKAEARPRLPKRFYAAAGVRAIDGGFAVTLDGTIAKTPGRRPMALPTETAATLVAAEFEAQTEWIDPVTMPIMRLCNSVIDGVVGQEVAVADDVARYAGSDLLCYRGTFPDGLIERQNTGWNPVLRWFAERHGLTFKTTEGVVFTTQSAETLAAVRQLIGRFLAFELAAVHQMTTLMGSVLLTLAWTEGAIDPETAWAAAHVDEDWEISQWGEDAEATQRRRQRQKEFMASVALFDAVRAVPLTRS